MLLIQERIGRIIEELQSYIYGDCESVECLYMEEQVPFEKEPGPGEWSFFKPGDWWGGRDLHAWFKLEVVVPPSFAGKEIMLRVLTGREDGWDAVNPQFIAYVDGSLMQGLDVNHRELTLSTEARAGESYQVLLHAYSGMEEKRSTFEAKLQIRNPEIKKLYYHMKVVYDSVFLLDKEDARRVRMLDRLNDAINLLDFREPLSKSFYDSIEKVTDFLEECFYQTGSETDAVVYCVGHAHIDVAWRWTVAQAKEKAARSFSTALRLMETYPEYTFMSSQPQLYEFVKEEYPQVYEKILQRFKEGRWEPEGAMWLEADCNLISGESLVRQVLFGIRFFEKEFGIKSKILWMPDVFGYSAALPQIMKKSGIEYFMTTKLSWNEFNKFPYDTFLWKGIDGTEVLSYLITSEELSDIDKTFRTTYSGFIRPSQIAGTWKRYQQKEINDTVLMAFGYGDGGGGPTEEMLENAQRLSKGMPGCPKVKLGRSLDFFETLKKKVGQSARLPKWVGELYFESHRGTYTSMARNKRYNRKCEFLYQDAEILSVMGVSIGSIREYPRNELHTGWKTILLNQFHDIIPGSSIKEVYEVSQAEYEAVIYEGKRLVNNALDGICSDMELDEDSLVVFNQLSFERDDLVKFKLPASYMDLCILDEAGNVKPVQIIDERAYSGQSGLTAMLFAEKVPSKGYKAFRLVKPEIVPATEKSTASESLKATKYSLQNRFFDIMLDMEGNITSIYDKVHDREIIKPGHRGNIIQAFEDIPLDYDAWNIDIFYTEKMWEINDLESIEVIDRGPLEASIEIKRKFQKSVIIQKICIYNDIPRIDFKTLIDWKESQILLKAAFPVDVQGDKATFDIQFGNVERPTHRNTSWDTARFEVCAHKWVDLSEDGFGVSLMNDCKYGYDVKDGNMRITLLKSGIVPNPDADKEIHRFTYSLYPHAGDWKEGGTVPLAYALNCPAYAKIEKAHGGNLPPEFSMISLDKSNVILETVKLAEDSDALILRLYECYNRRTHTNLTFFRELESVYECDLMENKLQLVRSNGNTFGFEIRPYEIKTFMLKSKTKNTPVKRSKKSFNLNHMIL